jgi:hypothetical protein
MTIVISRVPIGVENDLAIPALLAHDREMMFGISMRGGDASGDGRPVFRRDGFGEPIQLLQGLFQPDEIGFVADLVQKILVLGGGVSNGDATPVDIGMREQRGQGEG